MGKGAKKSPEIENSGERNEDDKLLWFVADGSELKGPFSTQDLKQKFLDQELGESAFLWRGGFREWRPLKSCYEIVPESQHLAFPTVDVPYRDTFQKSHLTTVPSTYAPPRKNVKLKLSRSRRPRMSAFHWFYLFLICVGFSYFTLYFVMEKITLEMNRRLLPREIAQAKKLGWHENALPMYIYRPILSLKHNQVVLEKGFPIVYRNFINQGEPELQNDSLLVKSRFMMDKPVEEYGLVDPIYRREFIYQGVWHPTSHSLRVAHPGSPYLPE